MSKKGINLIFNKLYIFKINRNIEVNNEKCKLNYYTSLYYLIDSYNNFYFYSVEEDKTYITATIFGHKNKSILIDYLNSRRYIIGYSFKVSEEDQTRFYFFDLEITKYVYLEKIKDAFECTDKEERNQKIRDIIKILLGCYTFYDFISNIHIFFDKNYIRLFFNNTLNCGYAIDEFTLDYNAQTSCKINEDNIKKTPTLKYVIKKY